MKRSLANKLLIYFAILNFLSILIVGVFAYTQARDALISRTMDQLTSVRIEKASRIQEFISQRVHEVLTLGKMDSTDRDHSIQALSVTPQFKEDPCILLSSLSFRRDYFDKVYLYISDSQSCGIQRNNDNGQFSPIKLQAIHSILFKEVLAENQEYIMRELIPGNDSISAEILICRPINLAGSSALLAFGVPVQDISDIMLDRNPLNGLGESGEAYLVGSDFLLRSSSRFTEQSIFRTRASTKGVHYAFSDSTGTAIFDDYRGISVLSSFSKIELPGLDWVILAEIDNEEAMVPIRNYGSNILFILITLSLLLLGAVALIANTITAPLRKLRKETERISQGNYDPLPEIRTEGEIRDLVQAFNQMTLKIKEQQDKLVTAHSKSISSMIDGQELERSRLAREIHDGLAQTILALKMRLENTAPEKAVEVLEESQAMFSGLMSEIRNISNDLMPAVLREFGLIRALESLLTQVANNSGLKVSLICGEEIPTLAKKTETYLYRIAQEATNNILKHAEAAEMHVEIRTLDKQLRFSIWDDGKGMDFDDFHKDTNGISNMRQRVAILGGSITFDKADPHGLKIQCIVPLNIAANG